MWPRSFAEAVENLSNAKLWADLLVEWQAQCQQNQIACYGSIPFHSDGNIYNRGYFIDSHGEVLVHYDKIHLFSPLGENDRYSSGLEVIAVEYQGLKFGLTICYDLRFPELYRSLRHMGADVILTIAQWPEVRKQHWLTLGQARAIENQVIHIGVNRTGDVEHNGGTIQYPGSSFVYDPWGESLLKKDSNDMIQYFELNPERIQSVRSAFPVWNDRSPIFEP